MKAMIAMKKIPNPNARRSVPVRVYICPAEAGILDWVGDHDELSRSDIMREGLALYVQYRWPEQLDHLADDLKRFLETHSLQKVG